MTVAIDELKRMARQALVLWALPDQQPELLKYRENAVFRVRLANGDQAALRLHRSGYHSEASLRSELLWMDDLRRSGLRVPQPLPAADGSLLVSIEGSKPQFADLIGWVAGTQIGETGKRLEHAPVELAAIYRAVGTAMAEVHNSADRWIAPADFHRPAWDADGLLGDAPLWGRFWDCPAMSASDRLYFSDLRPRLRERLRAVSDDLDFGLIHADLVRENVLVDGDSVALIDFDDCGYGWRLFDIATTLLRNRQEEHYALIRSALLEGYRSRRKLEQAALAHLPLFLLLRSLTYIGWAGARPELPDAADRMVRYVRDARELADALDETP
jgi:Ser/Thr protein kinase RdoA (MazF antagonist)